MAIIYLEAVGIGAIDAFSLAAGATKMEAVDGRPVNDDSKYVSATGGSNYQHFTVTQFRNIARVNANPRLVARARINYTDIGISEAMNGGVYLGGARTEVVLASYTDASAAPGPWTDYDQPMARPGGGSWLPSDLSSVEIFGRAPMSSTTSILHLSTLYLYVDVTLAERGYAFYGSRRLRLRRLPNGIIEARVPTLEFLDQELLDLMAISHPDLPSGSGRGAGVKPWERWPVLKLSSEVDWDSGQEIMQLLDLRDIVVRYWDVGKATKVSSDLTEGIPRLDSGNTRAWTRESAAWVFRADSIIAAIGSDSDKHDINGDLFESASANLIIQSVFKNGATNVFTGWTQSGAGSNGSAIAEDTTDNLFDSTVTTRSVKLTAGTPIHAADLQIQSTATESIPANTVGRVSIWRRDDSLKPTYWALQRSVDSKWWRDSDSTWQVAKTWNEFAVTTTARLRGISKQVDVGASATTLTLYIGIPTTGNVGQVNHIFHAQWESLKHATSAIVTDTVKVARAADLLTISNSSASRSWIAAHGTWRSRVRPSWSAADVTAAYKTVFFAGHDSSNYDWCYFDGANARWVFERKAAGVIYRAVKAASPETDTEYKIACRVTGADGELDLDPYTLSIFVDGVKGTDAVSAALREVGGASLNIGSRLTNGYGLAVSGYVEARAEETNRYRMFGLSNGNPGVTYQEIDFAIYPAGDGNLYVYESGVQVGSFGAYAANDILRVAVVGGIVKYYRNGNLLYTSGNAPVFPLILDAALNTANATVKDAVISGYLTDNVMSEVTEAVVWTSAVNATITGDDIQKTAGVDGVWDSGAASTKGIAGGEVHSFDGNIWGTESIQWCLADGAIARY
jgi:hypothetical protein